MYFGPSGHTTGVLFRKVIHSFEKFLGLYDGLPAVVLFVSDVLAVSSCLSASSVVMETF